jgi:hypothetical protein
MCCCAHCQLEHAVDTHRGLYVTERSWQQDKPPRSLTLCGQWECRRWGVPDKQLGSLTPATTAGAVTRAGQVAATLPRAAMAQRTHQAAARHTLRAIPKSEQVKPAAVLVAAGGCHAAAAAAQQGG